MSQTTTNEISTDHETPVQAAPRIGALQYFFLALLATVLIPAAIVSAPMLFVLIFFPPFTIFALPTMIGLVWFLYWMKNTGCSRFHTILREDRLPKNPWILYLPLFLPLIYILIIAAIGFSEHWESVNDRAAFFNILLIPYILANALAEFSLLLGNGIEAIPALPLLVSFAVAVGATIYLLRFSPRRKKHFFPIAVFSLIGIVLSVVVFQTLKQMREYSLLSDYNVEKVRDEQLPIWDGYVDETDLKPYFPFSDDNQLESIGSDEGAQIESDYPRLHGALALYPVYAAAVQGLYKGLTEKQAKEITRGGTSPEAFTALLDGKADMVFMLRPSEKQFEEAKKLGKTLSVTPIGREAFVFFVSRSNPVDDLTSQQIRDIYSKRITNWRELGGRDEKIMPFQRPEGSGSQTAMQRFMGSQPLARPIKEEYQELMGGIVNRVADYRNYGNSIGFSFRYYVEGMFKHEGVKMLQVDGIEPNPQNIRNGSYPLVGEMAIVTAGSENPNVFKLINWFLSPQGQTLIEHVGYVSLDDDIL